VNISINKLVRADIPEVCMLINATMDGDACLSQEQISLESSWPEMSMRTLRIDGNLGGFVAYVKTKTEILLARFVVDQDYDPIHPEERIMAHLVGRLTRQCPRIVAMVDERDLETLNMFKKLGFLAIRISRGDQYDLIEMACTRLTFLKRSADWLRRLVLMHAAQEQGTKKKER